MFPQGYTLGSCLTVNLTPKELDRLIALVTPLYLDFSPESTPEKIRGRLTRDPSTAIDLLYKGESLVCFGVYYARKVEEKKICFRDGIVLKEGERNQGFYKEFVQLGLDRYPSDLLMTRTREPRVYKTLRRFAESGGLYPREGSTPPLFVAEIAQLFCGAKEASDFDPVTLVVKNIHTDEKPFLKVDDPGIMEFFARYLGPRDAFMVVVPTR